MSEGIVHIAGHEVQVGPYLRQRCSWCGALIEDVDLRMIAVPIEDAGKPYPMWKCGALVEVIDGNPVIKMSIEHEDGSQIPPNCCAALDPTVTE